MHNQILSGFQLSPQQKHLWLLQQSSDSLAFRSLCAIEIKGNLNLAKLNTALKSIIDRHQILRTSFHCLPGMTFPLQSIEDGSNLSIQHHDLKGIEASLQQNAIAAILSDAKQYKFDFEQPSLLQISLIALSANKHILLLNLPGLYADMISLKNLESEISRAYNASLDGTTLTDEPLQYILFSEWQNELLVAEEAEVGREYWKQQDISHIFNLKLPNENQTVSETQFKPQVLTWAIHPELGAKISSLATQFNISESIFLLACWQTLFWRLTGVSEMVVGIACDGRPEEELKQTQGLFAKYVPLHCHLQGKFKFDEVLEKVALAYTQSSGWQECFTWEDVLEPNSTVTKLPFFPLCFDYTEQSQKISEFAEIIFSRKFKYVCFDRFKLRLSLIRSDDFIAELHYDSNLFSSIDIQNLAAEYQTLLESVVQNPQAAISELEILNYEQQQQLLVDFNHTQIDFPTDKCFHQLFEEQVERTPHNIAVICTDQQLTYAELNTRANQLAHHLQKLGAGPDVLVGICLERSLEMVVGLLAVLKAGSAYLPLDPMYPKERLSFMLEDAQTPVLITQQQLLEILPEQQGHLICLDTDWQTFKQESELNPTSNVVSENLAYVIYTSGSTGKPKGVMLPHRAICNHMFWMQANFAFTETDKVLQKTPFSFDASVWEFYAPLLVGAQLVMARPGGHQDTDYLIELIVEQQITIVQLVPTLLRMLLENDKIGNCHSLKHVFCGGEALTVELKERFFAHLQAQLHNLYGPTETCIDATFWTCQQGINSQIVPIGHPISNTQVYILDSQLRPVPIGILGELYIGGAGLAKGYLNRPELTAEKFITNPYHSPGKMGTANSQEAVARMYKTGDLARFLPDGSIEYLGRIDHQVKIRGFRIELGEIESLLSKHPQVREVAVIAREDEPGNLCLVTYVVPQSGQTLPEGELPQLLKEQLPNYMLPSAFVILEALPLTPNGKLDRHALPIPQSLRNNLDGSYVPPRNTLELQLAQIWENILKIHPVGVRDDFFKLGGHSLLAVRLMAQIQQRLGKNLPLATLFQNPNIEQMAEVLRQESGSSLWSSLVAIQPQGSKPPFFCVPGAGGNVLYFYHLAHHLGSDQPFYGLQALGLDGESQPHTRVEDIAAHYIQSIQTIQPEGPYFLGGHSFGGHVAFEMAQQLQASGDQVAFVAIFDTPSPEPGILPERFNWDGATWLVYLAQIVSRLYGKQLQLSYDELQTLNSEEQLQYFKEQLTMVDLLPPEAEITQVRGLVRVFQANKQTRYLPKHVFPTRIVLFRASDIHPDDAASDRDEIDETKIPQDAAWGWNRFASESVDVQIVPGDHLSMLVEPQVQSLAERLQTYIQL